MTNDVAFEGAYDGRSGLAVAPGAEVVIFVQEGCRLTAKGKSGDAGGAGGGAGILCPSNSTLIITGPGSVQATGGGGASGEGRGKASPGFIYDATSLAGRGGKGGSGGAGGNY